MNISYDPSRRQRSAAGTARTTPGTPGTTNNPRGQGGFRYGSTPSTPPSSIPTNPNPHLSKAAGGKGAGAAAGVGGQKPQWLTNTQDRFQSRLDMRNKHDNQMSQMPSMRPGGVGPEAPQMAQVGPAAEQMYNSGAPAPSQPPQYSVTTPGPMPAVNNEAMLGQPPALAADPNNLGAPANQIGGTAQMQQMLRDPNVQNLFQQWLQQQYSQGLLTAA